MSKNTCQTAASQTALVERANEFVIEHLNPRLLHMIQLRQTTTGQSQLTTLTIMQSLKVDRNALVQLLQQFHDVCKSSTVRFDVAAVIESVKGLAKDGKTKLYVVADSSGLSTKIEFLCVAVRMRAESNGKLCDFCFASSSYSNWINKTGLAVGGGFLTVAGIGGLVAGTILTGGLLPAILIFGGATTAIPGATMLVKSIRSEPEGTVRERLEADFLYELISRGLVTLDGDKICMKDL